jgi:hypothetical protein
MAGRERSRAHRTPMAGGCGPDLRPGEKMLSATQTGACLAGDAPWNCRRSQSRLAAVRLLWTTEHSFHRAGESDRPTWSGSAGPPHLGHSSAVSTPARPPGMVARLLSLCPSTPIATRGAHAASLQGEMACAGCPLTKKPAQSGFTEAIRILHHTAVFRKIE